jgi:hypothetical protein
MSDRRSAWLQYSILVLVALNLGFTVYFNMAKTPAASVLQNGTSDVENQVTEKEALEFARSLVDLYNENKTHEIYLKFDDLARIQLTEQKLTDELAKLHALVGRVDELAYVNGEVAGKDAVRTYLALNFRARISGAAFATGTVKLTVARKDGRLALYGFFINGQTN